MPKMRKCEANAKRERRPETKNVQKTRRPDQKIENVRRRRGQRAENQGSRPQRPATRFAEANLAILAPPSPPCHTGRTQNPHKLRHLVFEGPPTAAPQTPLETSSDTKLQPGGGGAAIWHLVFPACPISKGVCPNQNFAVLNILGETRMKATSDALCI